MTSLTAPLGPSLHNTPPAEMNLCYCTPLPTAVQWQRSLQVTACGTLIAGSTVQLLYLDCFTKQPRQPCQHFQALESHSQATALPQGQHRCSTEVWIRRPHGTCKGICRTSAAGLALPVCSRHSKLRHILCQNVNCLSADLPSAFLCQGPAPSNLWLLKPILLPLTTKVSCFL